MAPTTRQIHMPITMLVSSSTEKRWTLHHHKLYTSEGKGALIAYRLWIATTATIRPSFLRRLLSIFLPTPIGMMMHEWWRWGEALQAALSGGATSATSVPGQEGDFFVDSVVVPMNYYFDSTVAILVSYIIHQAHFGWQMKKIRTETWMDRTITTDPKISQMPVRCSSSQITFFTPHVNTTHVKYVNIHV
jgi:hypothetical protein